MLKNIKIIIPVLVAVVIAACLLVATYARNRVYKTPVTLWEDASSKSAMKRRTHENYGQALSTAGFYPEALRQFETVLALKDDGSVPMRDLYREMGVVFFRMGLFDDSISAWETGLKHAPSDPSILNNLSVVFIAGRTRKQRRQSDRRFVALICRTSCRLANTRQGSFWKFSRVFSQPSSKARMLRPAINALLRRKDQSMHVYQYANQHGYGARPGTRKNALGLMKHSSSVCQKRAP
jgi:tetratricopeptide (TPR) repeat protein